MRRSEVRVFECVPHGRCLLPVRTNASGMSRPLVLSFAFADKHDSGCLVLTFSDIRGRARLEATERELTKQRSRNQPKQQVRTLIGITRKRKPCQLRLVLMQNCSNEYPAEMSES